MGRNCPSTIESHVIAEAMLNLQARLKYGQAILVKWESISAQAWSIDTEKCSQMLAIPFKHSREVTFKGLGGKR